MLYRATVTKWTSHKDSKNRVGKLDLPVGREYLINTNRISDLVSTGINSCKCRFIENDMDRRAGYDYMEMAESVANIDIAHNVVASKFLTLPMYQDNKTYRLTTNTTVLVDDIVYVDVYNPDNTKSWVVYIKEGFKRVEALCNLSLSSIYNESVVGGVLLDYDGNEYTTVVIGNQEWITTNLRTTTYGNGVAIPEIQPALGWLADVTGAYCWYNNNILNGAGYGALYNWYAATSANGLAHFTRAGVHEIDWRIPSRNDWYTLVAAVGGDYTTAGGFLKEAGDAHWDWGVNTGTDTYGFAAVGNGNRMVDDHSGLGFVNMGTYSDTWCSDENPFDITSGLSIYMSAVAHDFFLYSHEKYGGMAIRCVRDI